MKKLILKSLLLVGFFEVLSLGKPMESITNYNVIMVHGAYGSVDGNGNPKGFTKNENLVSAFDTTGFLGNANIGKHDNKDRITYWLSKNIFEEPKWNDLQKATRNSYIYHWRSFSNPANSSLANAYELGDRTWNRTEGGKSQFGHRRSLLDESQEVKVWRVSDSLGNMVDGQNALDIIRQNSDLYRQLASRYILIGHSMGGVVSREYVQGNFYNNDVDKVVTLDSPHGGTGALNMQIYKEGRDWAPEKMTQVLAKSVVSMFATGALLTMIGVDPVTVDAGMCVLLFSSVILGESSILLTRIMSPEIYSYKDPLVHYVDPYQKGYQTIDSLNHLPYNAEMLPMFRLLGSKNSMTFTDPTHIDYGLLGSLYLENFSLPFMNMKKQINGHGDKSTRYVNALVSGVAGIVGIPLLKQGSSLVSEESGLGKNTNVLNDSDIDIKKAQFNAAYNAEGESGDMALGFAIAGGAILGLEAVLGCINPAAAKAAKLAVGVAFIHEFLPSLIVTLKAGFNDLADSHTMPLYGSNLKEWYADYTSKISGVDGNSNEYKPYLMEDFLYEKPFVNLSLNDSRTMDSLNNHSDWNRSCYYGEDAVDSTQFCEIGLYGGDGTSFRKKNYADFRSNPLKFHSSSDWSTIGIKLDRWERVPGLDANGVEHNNQVPIRHVERYKLPKLFVSDFIEKYSFVVDDLMPHRLRQIRMNFNFQTEIAWECDIAKDSDALDACVVYADKNDGKGLDSIGVAPHPVLKNGTFDFEPAKLPDASFKNLSYFQKDNQNVVTISTVNKIGLSNTQRFYYLAKMTEDLYDPKWPLPNIVVTGVDNFTLTASALDYQGFRIDSTCTDIIFVDPAFSKNLMEADSVNFNELRMSFSADGKGATLTSAQKNDSLPEGHYIWQNNIVVMNDTSRSFVPYVVPFSVDRTPPQIKLYLDRNKLNPDSTGILARIKNTDATSDIRALHTYISKCNGDNCEFYAKQHSLYDVSSPNFALFRDSAVNFKDGKYRLNVFAIDRALPDYAAYVEVGNLIEKILAGTDSESDWTSIESLQLNKVKDSVDFYVDRTAPEYRFNSVVSKFSDESKKPFAGPQKSDNVVYVSADEKLKVSYHVMDSVYDGENVIRLHYAFMHLPDTSVADHLGDSITIKTKNGFDGVWEENSQMLLSDGDYKIKVTATDEAGNQSVNQFEKTVRIDRVAPNIEALVATKLVYPLDDTAFGAKLVVNEKHDVESNRSGFRCYSRITSAKKTSSWDYIDEAFVGDSVHIKLKAADVDSNTGKRYLEVGCIDAAGNISYMTDLFYVGEQYPEITSPSESSNDLDGKILVIRGIAAAPSAKYEKTTRYELSYKCLEDDCDSLWHKDGISRRDSNTTQPVEGVLGFWNRENINGTYLLKLDVIPCDSCDVLSDSIKLSLNAVVSDSNAPQVKLQVPDTVYMDSLSKILCLMYGDSISSYSMRVYGYDSMGVALFDENTDHIKSNPFYGKPADINKNRGIWFYGDSTSWMLKWKGMIADSLEIRYDSTAATIACESINGCIEKEFSSSNAASSLMVDSIFALIPEMKPNEKSNRKMILKGESGSVAIKGDSPISVHQTMDAKTVLPVFFGSRKEGGFHGSDSLIMYTWTADRENYIFKKVWNGMNDAGSYPAAGYATLYAEAIENKAVGTTKVLFDTARVFLVPPDLKVIAPFETLPTFQVFSIPKNSEKIPSPLKENVSYVVSSMTAKYGIYGRKANVSASIIDPAGSVIGLFENAKKNAGKNAEAYAVVWNGTEDGHTVKEPGVYTLKIKAVEANPFDPSNPQVDSLLIRFKLEIANNLKLVELSKDSLGEFWFNISEAKDDSRNPGEKRYEPIADYLVTADVSGFYMPKEYQTTFVAESNITGTQNILGFKPERFSLGIKRQRERLDLVYLTMIDRHTEKITGESFWCGERHPASDTVITKGEVSFNTNKKTDSILVDLVAQDEMGFDDDMEKNTKIDFFVMLKKDWIEYEISHNGKISVKDYKNLKTDKSVWALTEYLNYNSQVYSADSNGIHIPRAKEGSHRIDVISHEDISRKNVNCEVNMTMNEDSLKVCAYDNKSYSPEAKLFKVSMFGRSNENVFYEHYDSLNSHCGHQRWREIAFYIQLTIPDSYWDADFGYDNLVNRTIRFDGTNKSIYNTGTSGYMAALKDSILTKPGLDTNVKKRANNLFDGDRWTFKQSYGKVTPYETQHLPVFGVDMMSGAVNTFLFPDEVPGIEYPAFYELKFYNDDAGNTDSKYFVAMYHGYENGKDKQDFLLSSSQTPLKTTLLDHGSVDFYVSVNKTYGAQTADSIKYEIRNPAPKPDVWKDSVESDSVKFYALGSKVHYYYGDYTDSAWSNRYLTNPGESGYFKNLLNFTNQDSIVDPIHYPFAYWRPDSLSGLGLADSMIKNTAQFRDSITFSAADYNEEKQSFFRTPFGKSVAASAGMKYVYTFADSVHLNVSNDTLYVRADTMQKKLTYRRTDAEPLLAIPSPTDTINLLFNNFIQYSNATSKDKSIINGEWFKNRQLKNVKLTHLDSTEHSHFEANMADPSASNLVMKYQDSVSLKRPHEYVEMVAKLNKGVNYNISYFRDTAFYHIGNYTGTGKKERLGWFDMNHLQGNTSFILTWGGSNGSSNLNYTQYDLNVGSPVDASDDKTVRSLFGEVSVSFEPGVLNELKDITVRTTSAEEHQFDVFNNAVLTGPIIEVLPSMEFTDSTKYPRVQMKLSRKEIEQAGLSPDRVRLYKVDFKNGQFVPLSHVLYGYLKENGSPVITGANADSATCERWDDSRCYDKDDWAYMLISGETATFSVFAALDSVRASLKIMTMEVLPEVATSLEREIRVIGTDDFDLFLDSALQAVLPWHRDSFGRVMITLPNQDSTYIYGVAKDLSGSESMARPAKVLAQVVPAELNCSIPLNMLWLGLDNGYLEFLPNCNQPGDGILTIYNGTHGIASIKESMHDTLRFDGRYSGLKINNGIYSSRYQANSIAGTNAQFVGPAVVTDSARPVIKDFVVKESSYAINRVFNVTLNTRDVESDILNVKLTWVLGNDTLKEVLILPDTNGRIVDSINVTRYALDKCSGCRISLFISSRDLGHNHADTLWRSDKLFPYPTELALWYPAQEGSGNTAYEFTGTGHDLNLRMFMPWLSGSGLYFYHPADSAVGVGRVDLGTSVEYSMEARIQPGNPQDTLWRRVLGFVGTSGLNIELQNQGRNLRLVEGSDTSALRGYLSQNAWSHVVVAVDSAEVRFYIDGAKVKQVSAAPREREFYGTFSMGEREAKNFVGHVSDIRFYTKALNGDEVLALSLPIARDDEEEIHTVIVLGNEMEGFGRQFSCAVSGNGYFIGNDVGQNLNMSAYVPVSADYKAILYARSAEKSNAIVKVGSAGAMMYAGAVKLENVWRPVEISGVKIPMTAGVQQIVLNIPDGVQVAGIAFTNGDMVKPSQISWKSSQESLTGSMTAAQKVKSSVRFEGYPSDKSMIRPRIRLKNISSEIVNGFKIRYYFRGENPESVRADAYFPQDNVIGLTVNGEGFNTGYVEWAFDTTLILPGKSPYFGEGPLMGIYNEGYAPWYAEDDPSYVLPESFATDADGFVKNFGVIVLDSDNRLIGGSCVEMEDPIEALPPSVRVLAADMQDDQTRASEITMKLENLGSTLLRNYDVRYYFQVEEGLQPIFDVYNRTDFVNGAEMTALGNGRYQVNVHVGEKSLSPHNMWPDEFKFALHVSGWESLWNSEDDPSHKGLTGSFAETSKICVFDSTGKKIYGDEPVWVEPKVVAQSNGNDSLIYDYGYDAGISAPVVRTDDGLIVSMDGYPYVQLDLVYANGIPLRSIYAGSIQPGEQFIAVDWTGIDLRHTYLALRKNSKIISTKLLSNL